MVKAKPFSEEKIDQLIRLKYGSLVSRKPAIQYFSDAFLAKLFKCSSSHIRN